jgi:SAM-dependent methyltransferase
VLDVGSGLAQFSRLMAKATGTPVLGIEYSADQIAEARRQATAAGEGNLVELRRGDAMRLPLRDGEWGAFDLAHTRFVLEHVTDPLAVVRGMVKAVCPGGRVVLADDDHDVIRLWPEPPGFRPLWHAYMRVYDRVGADPYVGRRLVSLLHEAGATPVRNHWVFFGSCSGVDSFTAYVRNMIGLLESARERMLGGSLLTEAMYRDGVAALGAWGRRPDAALWFAVCWAEGMRPTT